MSSSSAARNSGMESRVELPNVTGSWNSETSDSSMRPDSARNSWLRVSHGVNPSEAVFKQGSCGSKTELRVGHVHGLLPVPGGIIAGCLHLSASLRSTSCPLLPNLLPLNSPERHA